VEEAFNLRSWGLHGAVEGTEQAAQKHAHPYLVAVMDATGSTDMGHVIPCLVA
jgi:hypothetical protein